MRKPKFALTPYLFLLPALLATTLFSIYPLITVFYYSFTDYDLLRTPQWVGLENFSRLWNDPLFWRAFGNSAAYLIVTPTLIVLSILLSIFVNRRLVGIGFFRAVYYLPVISGSVAIGIAWQWIFASEGGILNGALVALGLIEDPVSWLTQPRLTIPIAMLMTVWTGVGYYMVVFLAGLQAIPQSLYDAAAIDGCSRLQSHWFVTVPGLRPAIVFVAVISGLSALKVFDEIYVLTNGTGGVLNSGLTIVFHLWKQAFRLQNVGYASAVAVVLLVVTLSFSIFNVRILERGD